MSIYSRFFFIFLLNLVFASLLFNKLSHSLSDDSNPIKNIQYVKIFEKKLDGEVGMTVRVFDFKKNNGRNGIAVCGRKFYVFTSRGTLLTKSSSTIFSGGVSKMRIAKLSKDGYYDRIVVAGNIDKGDSIKVFDSAGICLFTIGSTFFLTKDLNGDGSDEIITDGAAYYTKDDGLRWDQLWVNGDIKYIQDIQDSAIGDGFCYNQYLGSVFAVDKNGKILYQTETIKHIRCLASGNLSGSGLKNNIAAPAGDGTIHVFGIAGNGIRAIPMSISGQIIDLNEVMSIQCGKLNLDGLNDDIVLGGRRGLVACDSEGRILWSYIKWAGQNSAPTISELFINDLNGDGNAEVIAGKGNEIFIFSDRGALLDKFAVRGSVGRWQCTNSTMDIADINDDGYKEIIAVTSEGWLYVFGLVK